MFHFGFINYFWGVIHTFSCIWSPGLPHFVQKGQKAPNTAKSINNSSNIFNKTKIKPLVYNFLRSFIWCYLFFKNDFSTKIATLLWKLWKRKHIWGIYSLLLLLYNVHSWQIWLTSMWIFQEKVQDCPALFYGHPCLDPLLLQCSKSRSWDAEFGIHEWEIKRKSPANQSGSLS